MESKQALAASINAFLTKSISDGTVPAEDRKSVESAIRSIQDAFKCSATLPSSVGLEQIFSVYEKTQAKTQASSNSTEDFRPKAQPSTSTPSAADLAKAEQFKSQGNQAMSKKNYALAIQHYTSALEIDPNGKVYLSNRAAAYSSSGDHDAAIQDATRASEIDPNYGKAWSRLGHAYFGKGDLAGAKKAYEAGVKVDPSSDIMKRGLETSTKKLAEQGETTSRSPDAGAAPTPGGGGMPDLSALAGMFGGAGGGGGGMPDLSQITSNPAFMSMAQNLMSSGALDGLLNNPRMAEMARNFQNGGGMPDMNAVMQDPELRGMAENFGRSFGGGANGNNSGARGDGPGNVSEDP